MFGFGKQKINADEISADMQKLIDALGCPYEYFPKGSSPDKVINAYEDAFAKCEMGGFTPVIVTSDYIQRNLVNTDIDKLKEQKEILLKTREFNAQNWFTNKLTEWKNELGTNWNETVGEVVCEKEDTSKNFSGFIDFSNSKSKECILAKIPTNEPWEVFASLPFGGWNECPNQDEILWISKYWYERCKAVPAVVSSDILEFSVPPVKDKEAALGVALEHFAFCSDIVFQGFDTIGRLAGKLMQSTVWYFWWD